MAATGVSVSDTVISEFNEMKLGRVKLRFIVYKIEGGLIVTDSVGDNDTKFSDFLARLPADDCRYAIYDMQFTTNDGRVTNKLVSISWYDFKYSTN